MIRKITLFLGLIGLFFTSSGFAQKSELNYAERFMNDNEVEFRFIYDKGTYIPVTCINKKHEPEVKACFSISAEDTQELMSNAATK